MDTLGFIETMLKGLCIVSAIVIGIALWREIFSDVYGRKKEKKKK